MSFLFSDSERCSIWIVSSSVLGHANTALCSQHTAFFKSFWNQLCQTSRPFCGSESPRQLWFLRKRKIVKKAIALSTFNCGLLLNVWPMPRLSFISFQMPLLSLTVLIVASSHSSLWYLPSYHLACWVFTVSQGRRIGSEGILLAYMEHLQYPNPLYKWSYPFVSLFSNINCLWRFPRSFLTISVASLIIILLLNGNLFQYLPSF